MNTKEFLQEMKNDVACGKALPYQYHEQIYIAFVQKEITKEEHDELVKSIPFCPALVDGFVKQK